MTYNCDNRLEAEARAEIETLVPNREGKLSSNNRGITHVSLKTSGSRRGAEPGFRLRERDRILAGLSALLEVGEVKLTRALAGSIRLHLELTPEDADKLYVAAQKGLLDKCPISAGARRRPTLAQLSQCKEFRHPVELVLELERKRVIRLAWRISPHSRRKALQYPPPRERHRGEVERTYRGLTG